MQFGQKKSLAKYINKKVWIGILLAIVLLQSLSVYDRYKIAKDMSQRHQEMAEELEYLETRKEQLQKEVDYRSAERGVEEEIRSNFDVAGEGEQVIILTGEAETVPEYKVEEPKSEDVWWQFWR